MNVSGPDGIEHEIDFQRNKQIEKIISESCGLDLEIYEGNLPWIQKLDNGNYQTTTTEGTYEFKTAVKGGFFNGLTSYLHILMSLEEKLAIEFHEIVHIVEEHTAGHDIETEEHTTREAIGLVSERKDYFKSKNIDYDKIIAVLKERLVIYKEHNL